MNNMLSVEEVRNYLELSQLELEKYLKEGRLKAYKIGGTYLRFRKEDVLTLRSEVLPRKTRQAMPTFWGRLADFWRFNNFYILSIAVVSLILLVILKY